MAKVETKTKELDFLQRILAIRSTRNMSKKIKYFDSFFNDNPRKMTIGLEVECVLIYKNTLRPVKRQRIMDDFVNDMDDERIYRDYYPHQIEIRTKPHDNPADCFKEYMELYKKIKLEANKRKLDIAPTTYFRGVEFCGTHIHIKYDDDSDVDYHNVALASYPFILMLAMGYRDFPTENFASKRLALSPHLKLMPFSKGVFDNGSKMRDMYYNRSRREGKHRVKDVDTLETRLYDTVTPEEMEELLATHYWIMSHIKPYDNKDNKKYSLSNYESDMYEFRKSIGYNVIPYNNIFLMQMDDFISMAHSKHYMNYSSVHIRYLLDYMRGNANNKNIERHIPTYQTMYPFNRSKSSLANDFDNMFNDIHHGGE